MFGRAIPFILYLFGLCAIGVLLGWLWALAGLFVGPALWLLWEGRNAPTAIEDDRAGFVVLETAQERRAKRRGAIAPGARAVVK